MSMEHKAYGFDWLRFEFELQALLNRALIDNDSTQLEAYIDRHLAELKDPCDGQPLSADWRNTLENRDIHEYGDYALTRFYNPADDCGVGYLWSTLSQQLPVQAAKAMLGVPVGPPKQLFDPGRYGSYFQPPDRVGESLAALQSYTCPELAAYLRLLERCVGEQCGVYVTF